MVKIHTREKRMKGLVAHKNGKKQLNAKKRIRPKSFKTEESAKKYAELHGKEGNTILKGKKYFLI